jgi:alpha-glucosidase
MPWQQVERGGFSSGKPWLPVPTQHLAHAVEVQERAAHSNLRAFRRLLHWRRQQPALLWGSIEFLAATEAVLAFTRRLGKEQLLVAFNLSAKNVAADLPRAMSGQPVSGHGLPEGLLQGARLTLPPHGVLFIRLG